MSERKSVQKYYPKDFNPDEFKNISKKLGKKLKNNNSNVQTVRLMVPFTISCLKCSEFIHKGKKFNAKKHVTNERYLNIKIYQLCIRCPRCNNEIKYKTDPKSGDYIMEVGGKRNYVPQNNKTEVYKDETLEETLDRLEKEEKEENERLMSKEKNGMKNDSAIERLENKIRENEKNQRAQEELSSILQRNAAAETQ
ncbi:mRNA splicing protein YJU2 ASCRUDRAFT_23831, partial [Ascoidea rubescens DSM 1968]